MKSPASHIFFLVLVVLLALAQRLPAFALFGIRPNLILVFLIATAFFMENFFFYLFLVLTGYFLLKLDQGLDWSALILSLNLIISFWLVRILPWKPLFNLLVVIGFSTLLFYLILSSHFIVKSTTLFVGELLYNLVLGIIFYELVRRQYTL